MSYLFPKAAGLLFAAFCTAPSVALAQMETHLGPIAQVVELGVEGVWERADDGGWFRMSNETDPDSVVYNWYEDPSLSGPFRIGAYVAVRSVDGNRANGGLLFNYRSGEEYLAFTLGEDNLLHLFIRTPEGLDVQPLPEVQGRGDGTDRLSVLIDGSDASLELNGTFLFKIQGSQTMSRKVGILGAGAAHIGVTGLTIAPAAGALPDNAGPGPARNPETRSAGLSLTYTETRIGVSLGVFLHEFAHAVIGETRLPAPGNEEDIADSFSAHAFAQMVQGTQGPNREGVQRVVEAYGAVLYQLAQKTEAQQEEMDWQDEHSPDIRRFRTWICIVYGANPQSFEALADRVDLNDRTRERCRIEYPIKYTAWEELLQTRGRNLGPDNPGAYPADYPGGKILVNFAPVNSTFARETEQMLRSVRLVEGLTELFEEFFVWPRNLNVTFRECGETNAWYDPQSASVTMCYEVIEFLSSMMAAR